MKQHYYTLLIAVLLAGFFLMLVPRFAAAAEPSLPAGLDNQIKSPEPELPMGLGLGEETVSAEKESPLSTGILSELDGFWDVRAGLRTQHDSFEKDASLGEMRLQLETQHNANIFLVNATCDFVYDPVFDNHGVHLEEGLGFVDLREANILFTPVGFMDVKLGRQILTWGTGDMLFLNDLFPKDWRSFFIGRDVEYLKAPSDALKTSFFTGIVSVDVVYTPRFDTDRFIEGERISYWNDSMGRRAGRDAPVATLKPDEWFHDDELAIRFSKNVKGYELAAYGYSGFWKSPAGQDFFPGLAIFPDLSVYGASLRGKFSRGIVNLELAYYDSRDDRDGNNPFVRNSEMRTLLGYEQEIYPDFTMGLQYYLEYMLDYADYIDAIPPGLKQADEDRHVITLRLTRLLMNQNLKLSLFTYYSPSDQDAYLRPLIHYKVDDYWAVEAGGNLFWGENDYTFFGQFEKNSNFYTGVRFNF